MKFLLVRILIKTFYIIKFPFEAVLNFFLIFSKCENWFFQVNTWLNIKIIPKAESSIFVDFLFIYSMQLLNFKSILNC